MKINIQYNVGKCKYVVNYSKGDKKHKDGSEFFDIAIFKSKKAMNDFITKLHSHE
jgi:putative sterol carrier protein